MKKKIILLGFIGVLIILAANSLTQPGIAAPDSFVSRIFMPLIQKPASGISGQVTLNGSPAGYIPLFLEFFDGSKWTDIDSTTSGSDGRYSFTGLPSLNPGELYTVVYFNDDSTSGCLWVAGTRDVTSYTAGSAVDLGSLDIADIVLGSPHHGAVVGLPTTFRWTPRPATPTDSYVFYLYNFEIGGPEFVTDPELGYVSSYTLSGLPPGFSAGVEYSWEVWLYGPDGSFGVSYEYNDVTFSGGGLQQIEPKTVMERNSRLWEGFRKR